MKHEKFHLFRRWSGILLAILSLLLTPILLVSAQRGYWPKFDRDRGLQSVLQIFTLRGREGGFAPENGVDALSVLIPEHAANFKVLGHTDLGAKETYGDVWVHGNTAYIGTWSDPCLGNGVKIIDVSNLKTPQLIASMGKRPGTSAEDVVVRSVSTAHFSGDLAAIGIQRCGDNPRLDTQQFGIELWNVSHPQRPKKLAELGLNTGGGGVHELDLFQRGDRVYVLAATPYSEWFDEAGGGDFRIIDATDPTNPVQVGEWGAGAHELAPGPFYGQGSFGASFDHSARASDDGTKAYVSYWDLGLLTLDISDVTNPVLVGQTDYPSDADGETHSMTEYHGATRNFLLVNDEDFDTRSPANILYGDASSGIGSESPGGKPLWDLPDHSLSAQVIMAANQGCTSDDYTVDTAGKIAVVYTPFPLFDPEGGDEPLCTQAEQDMAAAAAGAAAVVHDFVSTSTSPQWWDFGEVDIPVLFTDHATAQGMVAAGSAVLVAQEPSWGFLRIFDAATGDQIAAFDDLPYVHLLHSPIGDWSIHNTEVAGDRSYSSWYSHGIVALDLSPLNQDTPGDPIMVGQFQPKGAPSRSDFIPSHVPMVWGVAIRSSDNVLFVSDMNSGLWIIKPLGEAAP